MKKQYLTSLLGFAVIFAPLTNSLINTNPNLCNSINNQTQEESIISEENSQVIVKDLDHDGKASQGDQIDEIHFSANYNVFHPLYEDEAKTILSNEYGLNIYTKKSIDTIKPFYSVSYNKINSLNQSQEIGFLNFDFNSTDNSTWKIWDTKLLDNSQEFIITAEISKNNHQEKIIENKIGEIPIIVYKEANEQNQRDPEITSVEVTEYWTWLGDSFASVSYTIDYGYYEADNEKQSGEYLLKKVEIIDHNGNDIRFGTKEVGKGNYSLQEHSDWLIELTPNTTYDLYMEATFYNPVDIMDDDPVVKTKEFDNNSGKFTTDKNNSEGYDDLPNNNNAMTTIIIIIGVFLAIAIISFVGYYFFKKNR